MIDLDPEIIKLVNKHFWSLLMTETVRGIDNGVAMIMRAMTLASEYHLGQVRKYTGEPYIVHPMGVAELVFAVTNGCASAEMIAAAWLHDTLEDTNIEPTLIKIVCGDEVLRLVQELTQKSTKNDGNRAARKKIDREYLWTVSREAQTIKCCDIIHNCHGIAQYDKGFFNVYKSEARALLEGFPDDLDGKDDALKTIESWIEAIQLPDQSVSKEGER